MEIFKNGSRPTTQAPADWFTGTVWMTPIVSSDTTGNVAAVSVHFTPGARTAWHTHPKGQTLYITSGSGLFGLRDQPPQVIAAGDTVWIPAGEEHWHGAAPDTAMTHTAIIETVNGSGADWLDHVNDADYQP